MKLSQVPEEKLTQLTTRQITHIVFPTCCDDGQSADVALLLGGNPTVCPDRADAAAKLYHAGRVRYIMPTGGVQWDCEFGRLPEAELLRRYLLRAGVPDEVILPECEATTTIENMIFGTLQMQRRIGIRNIKRVMVVTSALHLNRSLRHARNLLPRSVEVSGFCIPREETDAQHWHLRSDLVERVMKEVTLLRKMTIQGLTSDIEFGGKLS